MYFSSRFKAVFGLILTQALAYQVKEVKELVGPNRESFLKYMSTLVDS